LSPKSLVTATQDSRFIESAPEKLAQESRPQRGVPDGTASPQTRGSIHLVQERVSPWARSTAKRLFDCACILPLAPVLIPLFLLVGLAVRLTSNGPVLFLQKRMGRHGRVFTIVKFRTLTHCCNNAHQAVTTSANQRFTPIGRFLRRWKLDEIPQLWNVLIGDMSLVGARPKLPVHQLGELESRPGITGAATIAFAREETVLARLPVNDLNGYYSDVILPIKHAIDQEYMARATFVSDFKLLVNTVLRRWDSSLMESLLSEALLTEGDRSAIPIVPRNHMSMMGADHSLNPEEQLTEA
jgi:lipopolysaccharide/colanic/teichoic acid biosynthesis glycosyltransferase